MSIIENVRLGTIWKSSFEEWREVGGALDSALLGGDVEDVVASQEGVAVLALQLAVDVLLSLEDNSRFYQ